MRRRPIAPDQLSLIGGPSAEPSNGAGGAPDEPPAPEGEAAPERAAVEPTSEQRAAIAARERDAFLEAGAGTGKTTVLVDRYCAAIVEDGVEVERILAFTFTERAAAEMRTRIRRELMRRSRAFRDEGDSERADQLLRAARASERAWVMTIHAFCRRLLAAHPLAAGLDPAFRVLDASETVRLRTGAANAALDALLAAGDREVARAAAAYQPWRLAEMALSAHERLRSQGMIEPRLPPVPDPRHSPKKPKEDQRDLTPAEDEAARCARAALERVLEGLDQRYEELKRERSALDFQDLELEALELLRTTPVLAASWRERFDHVMVDEFQDTNRVQLELVRALRGDETRTLMVGDEHQSIYRFRNADLEVFRAERRSAERSPDSDVLPLRGNFRSLPDVLSGVNTVGRTLLGEFAELAAGRRNQGAGAVELLLTLDEGRKEDARKWDTDEIKLEPPPSGSSPRIVAEARVLAERLRDLVDDEGAGVERGDIVVLLRAFTHVDAYEEALERAGLRPFIVGGRGYWTQQQVEDLIRLLGVVANPLDDEGLYGALASFANSVTPDALWLLRQAARSADGHPRHVWEVIHWHFGGGDAGEGEAPEHQAEPLGQIDDEDGERLRRFCATLARLRAEAPLRTLEELIERTMSAFGYDLGLLARSGGAGRMANVRKLMRLAREYERNEGRDLAGFLALAAESTKRDEREGMAPVQAEGHDGVRVMTVHAAKGLQFPVVAVPDLGRRLNAGHQHDDVVIGSPPDEGAGEEEPQRFGMRLAFPSEKSLGLWELVDLSTEASAAEAEEGCRLVYVAASRAEDRLILSGVYGPNDLKPLEEPKPNDTPIRRLLPALVSAGWTGGDEDIALLGPMPVEGVVRLPDAPLRIRTNTPSPERAAELVRRRPAPDEPDDLAEATETPPLLDPASTSVPVGHLSYSALALYERCGYRFYLERVLGAREALASPGSPAAEADEVDDDAGPGAVRGVALGVGNTVHAALEWSARNGWERPAESLIRGLLAAEGLAGDDEAFERASRFIAGWLDSELAGSLREQSSRPEVPFVLGLGGTVVRGQIDLLAPGGDGGVPTVVDYKTDALEGRPASEVGERYTAQREIYALAAGGGKGARAVHVFLESPDDPVVEEFDAARLERARERLEQLVGRIRGGEFEVTEEPYEALCFGCPAAARLCPRPAWRPRGG